MKKIYSLISICICSGLTFSQVGTFDPTFNEGNPYQIQNRSSSAKIVSLTNETALNISNYGIPSTPGNPGEEHALIGKLTNVATSFASAQGIINPGFSDLFSGFKDFVVTSDNKVVVTGYKQHDEFSYSSIFVGRYNSDGTFDNTFNSGSFYELDFSTSFYNTDVSKVLVLSSGKIMCIGNRGGSNNMLIRLNSNGSIDNSYGTNGIYDWNFMGGYYSKIHDAVELSSGKLLVAGSEYDASNNNLQTAFVARINADGTIDNTFGTGGLVKVTLGQSNKESYINSIAIASTGEIIAAGIGYWTSNPWDIGKGAIVKISSDGVIDNTFGTYYLNADYSGFNKVIVAPNNEIIAGGYATYSNVSSSAFVFMSLSGVLNTTIDTDGILTSSNLPRPSIEDFTLQQDGKLIYVSSTYVDNFNNGLYVGRLLMSESTNSLESKNNNEFSIYPNPANDILSVSIQSPTTIRILDANGIELQNYQANSQTVIDVSKYAQGIYFIHTSEGQTVKFIKN